MTAYESTDGVFVATADCSTMNRYPGTGAALCDYYNLRGYPYLVYGTPDAVHEYTGSRDYGSLLAFAEQYLGPINPVPVPTPVPTPVPPPPTPMPPSPAPAPTPPKYCPPDAQEVSTSLGVECLWQSGVGGFTMPSTAVEYCDYFDSGYLGYYWNAASGDYACATSARKSVSGDQNFCLWQDGSLGFSMPTGSYADCASISQGSIGLVIQLSSNLQV